MLAPEICQNSFVRHAVKPEGPKRAGQRGGARLKAVLWTSVLVIFVYVCIKVTPALVNEFQFQDGVQTLARFATINRQPPEQVRAAILKEAEKDDVPVTAEDIKVESVAGNVKIHVDYSVTIDLIVYQWTLNFQPAVSNDSLT